MEDKNWKTVVDTECGLSVEISDDPLEFGNPYVFKEHENDVWVFGKVWNKNLDSGGNPVIQTLNPNMIRKLVTKIIEH